MRAKKALRYGAAALALGGVALLAFANAPGARGQASFVQDGKAGFVVSHIEYALSNDAAQTGACPNGMTTGYEGLARAAEQGQQIAERQRQQAAAGGQAPAAAAQGQYGGAQGQGSPNLGGFQSFFQIVTAPNGQNLCMNPEAGQPDPNFKTVTGPNVPAYGVNLDGQVSTRNGRAAPGTCAHDDFRGMNGERGIDNQFFRVVGCSNSFQSTGQSNTFTEGMLVGEWGILVTLAGVDDIRNDASVEVGILASADPLQLSPNRVPLPGATYAADQDPRFRATTHGRIVNGVLTTDPVDVRFHYVVNSIRLERPLRDARVRMTLSADGAMEGILAGYTPVQAAYDMQYGFRNGTNGAGEPANLQLRLISSNGQAAVQGHTCQGAYYAILAAADGHRDPATGQCTSISTQYRIHAIPAFVVEGQTRSLNADLDDQPQRR